VLDGRACPRDEPDRLTEERKVLDCPTTGWPTAR